MNAKRLRETIVQFLSTRRTLQQLREFTGIPERTLRYHLANLRRLGLLKETVSSLDRRRKFLVV